MEPRWYLIARIRHEITAGTYITDEKLCITAARLLQKLWKKPCDRHST